MPRRPPRPPVHRGHRDLVPSTPSAPGTSSGVDLDRAVADLNRIYVAGGLQTALAIGQYVLDTFFAGDIEAYRGRRLGWPSFRELRRRNDLVFSRTTLVKAVGVLQQMDDLPPELAHQLSITKHHALLPVVDSEIKVELAREAVDDDLSYRELRRRVWERARVGRRPNTRLPRSPMAETLRTIELKVRDLGEDMNPGGVWEHLTDEERADLTERVERVVRRLEGMFGG